MNKIEQVLLRQLQRHSTDYIESAERGIVCDDLDVDGFVNETSKMLQVNEADTSQDKALNLADVMPRTFSKESMRKAYIQGYRKRAFISDLKYDSTSEANAIVEFNNWFNNLYEA